MSAEAQAVRSKAAARADSGAKVVALSGAGLIGYGIVFLVRNFTGFTELGLTPEQAGGTAAQIEAFSPQLYHYISHLQVALSGFLIALGIAVMALAWFGIRSGARWALWTAFLAPAAALAIGLPLHYPYGIATIGHLGVIYADVAILLAGTILSYRQMKA